MTTKTKLELTWIGKDQRQKLEPRILLEDPTRSYHAARRHGTDDISDNVLIQGDNLLALKALEQEHAGKVRCVYIDPPYNTGSAFEQYDDGVEHSIWLSLLRERLELLRGLLRPDGSIWISIDDNEAHYLRVLCDEIFGRANFVANIVWEKRTSRENRRVFSFNHDHILVFAREKPRFDATRNPLAASSDILERYKNPDNDPRGPWQSVSATAQAGHATALQFYELVAPSGRRHQPPEGRCWLYTERRMQEEVQAGNIWFGKDGNGVPRIKKFADGEARVTPETLWRADEVGTNDEAKKHLLALFDGQSRFDTPKPEALIARILEIATNPGDVVLDSFLGSGTTAAVATKMHRRWLAVEVGDHASSCVVPRLKKVIDGQDPGGVTTATGWKGGGGFRFFRLAPSLLERDKWGNWVVSKKYNPAQLAEAMCKLHGFRYEPSPEVFWQHGRSTESDFLYVTTQTLLHEQLAALSAEVGPSRTLLVVCSAYRGKAEAFANLTVKKIPASVLASCEWGHDDYSLNVANVMREEPKAAEPPTPNEKLARAGRAKVAASQVSWLGEGGKK